MDRRVICTSRNVTRWSSDDRPASKAHLTNVSKSVVAQIGTFKDYLCHFLRQRVSVMIYADTPKVFVAVPGFSGHPVPCAYRRLVLAELALWDLNDTRPVTSSSADFCCGAAKFSIVHPKLSDLHSRILLGFLRLSNKNLRNLSESLTVLIRM